jgi:uncharacterized protein
VTYLRRVIDDELDEIFPPLVALALEGAKGVGKTETGLQRARTVHQLSDPDVHSVAEGDPAMVLTGEPPVFIDEYQRLVGTWDLVRNAVDRGAPPGSFLLAGSASTKEPRHSGAGRIPILRMRPLSLAERQLERPTVSLKALLSGDRPDIEGTSVVALSDYVEEIIRTGLPGLRPLTGRTLRGQIDGYLARILDRDVTDETGVEVRRPEALRVLMRAYAAATSTSTSWEKIRRASESGDRPSAPTMRNYREILTRLWILDPLPSWLPTMSAIRRTTGAPRHHLADPGLAARLLGADVDALLTNRVVGPLVPRDSTLLGDLFESLVVLSTRVYAQQAEARIFYFRNAAGSHEVDLIVERADLGFVALEVKLATRPTEQDYRHLRWLRETAGERMLDAIMVTTGRTAYRRQQDGIAVVPAALLGP